MHTLNKVLVLSARMIRKIKYA